MIDYKCKNTFVMNCWHTITWNHYVNRIYENKCIHYEESNIFKESIWWETKSLLFTLYL